MTTNEHFIGTWKLVSFEVRRSDGDITLPWGKDVGGTLMYDSNGRFSVQLTQNGRTEFASGDMQSGTEQEIRSALGGYVAYYGTYDIDETERTMTHSVEGSLFPNWIGGSQTRFFEISSDRLTLTTPPTQFGGQEVRAALLWERN